MARPRALSILLPLLLIPGVSWAQDLGGSTPSPSAPAPAGAPPPAETVAPAPAPTPQETPPPAPGSPPADQYVAPEAQGPAPAKPAATTESETAVAIVEPPVPSDVDEPPPPVAPYHRAPKTAFWVGARLGWFMPFGTLWHDGFLVGGACCVFEPRGWSDYASSGPMFEIDAGVRLSRAYNVFALWERASLAAGDLDEDAFGGQERGWTDFWAAGARFSTNPDDLGFLVELALGYRMFTAYWKDGTELRLTDGFFDARIGIGADIRLWEHFSLTPLITIASGSFGEANWKGPAENGGANDRFDASAQYGAVTLQVGGSFDIY